MSYYKRNLPHYQPIGYAFFVTIRLHGTIPIEIYTKLRNEYEKKLMQNDSIKNFSLKKKYYDEIIKNTF